MRGGLGGRLAVQPRERGPYARVSPRGHPVRERPREVPLGAAFVMAAPRAAAEVSAMLDPLGGVKSLLVPIDGSEAAYSALATACDFAKRHKASVAALHV